MVISFFLIIYLVAYFLTYNLGYKDLSSIIILNTKNK